MRFLRSKRGIAAIAALLLVLFLFRPGIYKLRNRIAISIGSALGRRVALDNVRLRLLPRPGFDLEGLVIYDDLAFSSEPMIRAQDVSAAIRFRSLLRGRLEIANLSATEPSINLVRNNEGHWNLASLLERNAQIPVAPTAKPASERRPAFPYLEASNARINFKIGQTKKSYALINADVALWQDSENSWGARIKAEPVRTDFNLTDTGTLQINARWQRAANLRLTPLQVTVQWRNGQLGQITKLFSGKDRGWRGGMDLTANLTGAPEALQIESAAAIEGFHRYDIVGSENVRLATTCSGRYNAITRSLAGLLCKSPVDGGSFRLGGDLSLVAQLPVYDLTLKAEAVPLSSVVHLLRQGKRQIPADLTAAGLLNGEFHATLSATELPDSARHLQPVRTWTGNGVASRVRLSSNNNEIILGTIPLALTTANSPATPQGPERGNSKRADQQKDSEFPEPRLRIGPVPLSLSNSGPMDSGGWISAAGYRFFLRGDADLQDLFHLENVLGLPVTRPAAEGAARLDVSVAGAWRGFAAAVTTGIVQLRNVHAEMRGLNTPLEIGSAALTLTPDTVVMEKVLARTGNTHWNGGVTAPRHCAVPIPGAAPGAVPNCVFQFDLTADQLSTGDLTDWFTPHSAKRPWYRILNSNEPLGRSPLLALQARGSLHVGRFGLKKIFASQIATQLEVDRGKITLTTLRAQVLQGTHEGDWTIDVSNPDAPSQPLRYRATGAFQDISLTQLGALMNDGWITGVVDGKFDVEGSGDIFGHLLASSEGRLGFVMRNGSLPHIELPGSAAPLPVRRFAGDLHWKRGGAWELSAGRLESHNGIYQVRGNFSPVSGANFTLTRGDEQSWALTGTLAKPHIAAAGRTEAKRLEVQANTIKP